MSSYYIGLDLHFHLCTYEYNYMGVYIGIEGPLKFTAGLSTDNFKPRTTIVPPYTTFHFHLN